MPTSGYNPTDDQLQALEALADEHVGRNLNDFRAAFDLCRRLLKDGDSPALLRAGVEAYCRRANKDTEDFFVKVLECKKYVKNAEGEGGWEWACQKAKEDSTELLPGLGPLVNAAANLCRSLSELNNPFPLSFDMLGKFLGRSKVTAGNVLAILSDNKVIAKVKGHDRLKREATEYRFMLDRPDEPPAEEDEDSCPYYNAEWPCPRASCKVCHGEKFYHEDAETDPAEEPPRSTAEPPRPPLILPGAQNLLDRLDRC
jgi:hypothetical protein